MKLSEFQFSNPILKHIEFSKNDHYEEENFDSLSIGSKTEIEKSNEKNSANVSLYLKLGAQDSTSPFDLKIIMSADFQWSDDINNNIDVLLSTNAPAVLLSYIRPIIALITSQAGLQTINIPFVNFTENKADFS